MTANKMTKKRTASYNCVPFSKEHFVAVQFPTAKQAKAFVRVCNMSPHDRRRLIIDAHCDKYNEGKSDMFVTILSALCFPAAETERRGR